MKLFKNISSRMRDFNIKTSRHLGDFFSLSPKIKQHFQAKNTSRKRILIIGVVLADRKNHYNHISSILNNSKNHDVHQVWAVLKANTKFKPSNNIEHAYFDDFIPRSKLINNMIKTYAVGSFDYIMITDDDIRLPADFLDQFLHTQNICDFSLAQPARTPNSITSHPITTQRMELIARETRFVEIGPFVSIRSDAQELILPLDERSPMGWGLDYVWPYILKENNKKMGIIDNTPLAHTLRPVAKSYNSDKALEEMSEYLNLVGHVKETDAHVTLHTHAYIRNIK